jgi:hypothetical protein
VSRPISRDGNTDRVCQSPKPPLMPPSKPPSKPLSKPLKASTLTHVLRCTSCDRMSRLVTCSGLRERPQRESHHQVHETVSDCASAERPEVQEHDPAAQVLDRIGPAAGVQPAASDQLRGANPGSLAGLRLLCGGHALLNIGAHLACSRARGVGFAGCASPDRVVLIRTTPLLSGSTSRTPPILTSLCRRVGDPGSSHVGRHLYELDRIRVVGREPAL